MLALEAALERLLATVPRPRGSDADRILIDQCAGRYLAESVSSPISLPPFDNSSMDGWAIRANDLTILPQSFPVQGEVAAGSVFSESHQEGQAIRIFTGSPLPTGADCVVMQEDTRMMDSGTVQVLDRVKAWENVRLAGEDVRRGDRLVAEGIRLRAAHLALLAAAGISHLRVHPPVRVGILPSGTELIPPGRPLPPGAVYECNGLALAELIRAEGGIPRRFTAPRDDPAEMSKALEAVFAESDMVVTAGGASVGKYDLVKSSFESLGGKLDFWRVAMKPGKPFFFGSLNPENSAAKPKYLFGVPGNPVAAFVTTILLVLPALRKLLGAADTSTPQSLGKLAAPLSNPEERRHFLRVRCAPDGTVESAGPQASHLLGSLAAADGLVDVPPRTQWPIGTIVPVLRWQG